MTIGRAFSLALTPYCFSFGFNAPLQCSLVTLSYGGYVRICALWFDWVTMKDGWLHARFKHDEDYSISKQAQGCTEIYRVVQHHRWYREVPTNTEIHSTVHLHQQSTGSSGKSTGQDVQKSVHACVHLSTVSIDTKQCYIFIDIFICNMMQKWLQYNQSRTGPNSSEYATTGTLAIITLG